MIIRRTLVYGVADRRARRPLLRHRARSAAGLLVASRAAPTSPSRSRRSPSRRCSALPAGGSSTRSTGASTAAATTPSERSRASPPASATRSTSTRSAPSYVPSFATPCNPPTSRSGCVPLRRSGDERPRSLVAPRAFRRVRRRGARAVGAHALTRDLRPPAGDRPGPHRLDPRLLGRRRLDRVTPVREPGRLDLPGGWTRNSDRAVLPGIRDLRTSTVAGLAAGRLLGRVGGGSGSCGRARARNVSPPALSDRAIDLPTIPSRRLARRCLAVRDGAGNRPRAGHALERYRGRQAHRDRVPVVFRRRLGVAGDNARALARSGVRVRPISLCRGGRAAAAPLVPRGGPDLHRLVLPHRLGRGAVRARSPRTLESADRGRHRDLPLPAVRPRSRPQANPRLRRRHR